MHHGPAVDTGAVAEDLVGMQTQLYADAPIAVRDDLPAAHQRFFECLARPGNWWTGAQRVAIAAEVRRATACTLCRERKEVLSPHAFDGTHDSGSELPEVAVDVVHRVTTDPARLSRIWFEKTQAAGLSCEQYVEILGLVVAMVSIDSFCRGLGIPLRALPDAQGGEPSRYRPESALREVGWVPMIPDGKASGPEEGLYGPGPRTGNVIRAMSLVPDAVRTLLDLSKAHYLAPQEMTDLSHGRALSRAQMELVASRISVLRECFY